MTNHRSRLPVSGRKRWRAALALAALGGAALSAAGAAGPAAASAHARSFPLRPGDLLVSRSVYTGTPGLLQPGVTVLPPGCTTGCVTANGDGTYPQVFNNDLVDPASASPRRSSSTSSRRRAAREHAAGAGRRPGASTW